MANRGVMPFCLEYDVVGTVHAYDGHIVTLDVLEALKYLLLSIVFVAVHADATYESYAAFHIFVMRQAIKSHVARVSSPVGHRNLNAFLLVKNARTGIRTRV